MTPEQQNQLAALRERNAARAALAKAALGTRWLLHPSNRVQRKPREFV